MRRLLFLLVMTAAVAGASAPTLTQAERDNAVKELQGSRQAFLDAVKGLTPAQWNFKPGPERWSIAQCAEHIAVSEDVIIQLVTDNILKSPAAPEKREQVKGKDERVLKEVPDRSQKFKAPEMLQPTGRFGTPEDTVKHFLESRDATIRFVQTTQEDLRDHFFDHPVMGTLDAYQWVLLTSSHTRRHTAQILEVKADAYFPK